MNQVRTKPHTATLIQPHRQTTIKSMPFRPHPHPLHSTTPSHTPQSPHTLPAILCPPCSLRAPVADAYPASIIRALRCYHGMLPLCQQPLLSTARLPHTNDLHQPHRVRCQSTRRLYTDISHTSHKLCAEMNHSYIHRTHIQTEHSTHGAVLCCLDQLTSVLLKWYLGVQDSGLVTLIVSAIVDMAHGLYDSAAVVNE